MRSLKTSLTVSIVIFQNILVRDNSEFVALNKIGIRRQKRKKGICLSESGLCALEELISVSCGECCLLQTPVSLRPQSLLVTRVRGLAHTRAHCLFYLQK